MFAFLEGSKTIFCFEIVDFIRDFVLFSGLELLRIVAFSRGFIDFSETLSIGLGLLKELSSSLINSSSSCVISGILISKD